MAYPSHEQSQALAINPSAEVALTFSMHDVFSQGWSSKPSRIRACREAAGLAPTSYRGKHGCGSARDSPGSPQASDGCSPSFDLSLLSEGLNSLPGTAFLPWGEAEHGPSAAPHLPSQKNFCTLDLQRFGFNKLSLPVQQVQELWKRRRGERWIGSSPWERRGKIDMCPKRRVQLLACSRSFPAAFFIFFLLRKKSKSVFSEEKM